MSDDTAKQILIAVVVLQAVLMAIIIYFIVAGGSRDRHVNVLELFAGIGGIGLGLERAGMTVVGQVEIDPYCQRVLAKHWPEVPRHDDVRTCIEWWRAEPRPPVDLIAGGFPCQDISQAGRRAGIIEGTRSSLWAHMADCVRELRPRYLLVENVAALLVRGLDVVLADLAACGYDAEWDCIPAAAVGAPHQRDRVWLVAYPQGERLEGRDHGSPWQPTRSSRLLPARSGERRRSRMVADPDSQRRDGRPRIFRPPGRGQPADHGPEMADAARVPEAGVQAAAGAEWERTGPSRQPGGGLEAWWATEPDVGRVAHGVPARVDRLRALGNAVVPQVAEHVGRLIVEADRARR